MLKRAVNECCAEPSRHHLLRTDKKEESREDIRVFEVARSRRPKRVAVPLLHLLSLLAPK